MSRGRRRHREIDRRYARGFLEDALRSSDEPAVGRIAIGVFVRELSPEQLELPTRDLALNGVRRSGLRPRVQQRKSNVVRRAARRLVGGEEIRTEQAIRGVVCG